MKIKPAARLLPLLFALLSGAGCVQPHLEDLASAECLVPADCAAGTTCAAGQCVACGPERCDGLDNDCDGQIDEDFDLNRSAAHCGACDRPCDGQCQGGICRADGGGGCEPGAEVCDGQDNDCDGQTDEGLRNACGACGPAPEEVCDGQDNDCDGRTDEGVANPCGGCGPAPEETCNGADDDCDGQIDEGVLNACGRCGAPPAERCDGQDNDCDGQIDEDYPDLNAPCTAGLGVCEAAGVVSCAPSGEAVCSATPSPAEGPERCGDGLDDDCDGAVDEALLEGLACVAGVGACERPGQTRCDPEDPTRLQCDAIPGAPEPERCDGIDNDCDGVVDNGFDLALDPRHCGACGNVCRFDNAAGLCEQGACVLGPCVAPFADLDGDPVNGCECNRSAVDAPDPTFTDVNCDGVDGDAARAVFVSPRFGEAGAPGTIERPVPTLEEALALADAERPAVLLEEGRYLLDAPVTLRGVVRLHGGYRFDPRAAPPTPRWSRRAPDAEGATVIEIAPEQGPAVIAEAGAVARLDNLWVGTADAVAADSAVAIVAAGCGELILSDVAVSAGAGRPGAAATPGAPAPDTAGQGNPARAEREPAAGGRNPACDGATAGGSGGEGSQGEGAGRGEPGGAGARGGLGASADQSAEPGRVGRQGAIGAAPEPPPWGGQVVAGAWRPHPPVPGNPGGPGGGGGGGGGGFALLIGGYGGAGGGAGGCGGEAATPAQPGGSSVGVLVEGGCRLRLVRARIQAGPGGPGGAGAPGGPGARGALGGAGLVDDLGPRAGAAGGDGAAGGCGAPAAGAHGGHSLGILIAPGGRPPAVDADSEILSDGGGPPGGGVPLGEGCRGAPEGIVGQSLPVACCVAEADCGDLSCPQPPG